MRSKRNATIERKTGQLLPETDEQSERARRGESMSRNTTSKTLSGTGISRDQSSKWQRLAAHLLSPGAPERITPAAPEDLADALAFAFPLRFDDRRRVHDAGEFSATIVAELVVAHFESAGFEVIRKPPSAGAAALARGFKPPKSE